jgi:galactose mutarotase-like enzyme
MAGRGENVVITVGDCSLTVLPAFGGKIASLRVGQHELLHAPLHPYQARTATMNFPDSDAGGWDECLPSVGACSVDTEAGVAAVPDHGDLWGIPWQVLEATSDSVTMRVRCTSLPLELTRSLILAETRGGWRLQLLYSLTNLGIYRVPWSWAGHALFTCEADDRIVLPAGVNSLRLEGGRGNRLGAPGSRIGWPLAELADGSPHDLSRAYPGDFGIGDKLFAGPLSERNGWCAVERSSIGLRLTIRFETALTPFLGLWLCYGGWPEGGEPDAPKQVCIAPEPATAPVDSLAEAGQWTRWLDAGETVTWPMEVAIERTNPDRTDTGGMNTTGMGNA